MAALRSRDLTPEEQLMWQTAVSVSTVPSFYVKVLLITVQDLRDKLQSDLTKSDLIDNDRPATVEEYKRLFAEHARPA